MTYNRGHVDPGGAGHPHPARCLAAERVIPHSGQPSWGMPGINRTAFSK